jgi:hypothetical protein
MLAGLARRHWVEPIEEFVRTHAATAPRWAVICTYEIDLERLASGVAPVLSRRGRQYRTLVLADGGPLEGALATAPRSIPGAFNVHPVRLNGRAIFHPKLVLLRAGRHARVVFGSANATGGGLGGNLELWSHSDDREILAATVAMLRDLAASRPSTLALDPAARRGLLRATVGLTSRTSETVWSSLYEPFARRLARTTAGGVGRAIVVSPLYASEGGVQSARRAIPAPHVDFYTSLPAVVPSGTAWEYSPRLSSDSDDSDPQTLPATLHAKAYVLVGGRSGHVAWTGSANFTAPALRRSVSGGGNFEFLVRTSLTKQEVENLAADLEQNWKRSKPGREVPAPEERLSSPRGSILSGELLRGRALSLRLYAAAGASRVPIERTGQRIDARFHRGTATINGPALARLLRGLDLSFAQPLVLHEIVGRSRIPFVVNVPFVPEGADGDSIELDALVDDFLGRVRVASAAADDEGSDGESDDEDPEEVDEDLEEDGERLDEAAHQGRLDLLAVKAVLLGRIARRLARVGVARDEVLKVCARALVRAAPHHLASTLRARLAQGMRS